jgi:nitrite reductase/ring-hydroxylating ferredoxin subunit
MSGQPVPDRQPVPATVTARIAIPVTSPSWPEPQPRPVPQPVPVAVPQPVPLPAPAPERTGTARRTVLAGLGVAAAGGLGCLVAIRGQRGEAGTTTPRALVALADVPAGGGTVVKSAGVVVTRDEGGQVRAFSAICTHQGCTVASVSGGTINCPCHGSRFDAATGTVVAGPAKSPLPPIAVAVRDGSVVRA